MPLWFDRIAAAETPEALVAFFTAACERTNHLRVTDEGARALFSEKSIPKLFKEQSPPL